MFLCHFMYKEPTVPRESLLGTLTTRTDFWRGGGEYTLSTNARALYVLN